jgi:hypothetical protein
MSAQEVPGVISVEIDIRESTMSTAAKTCMRHGGAWLLAVATHKPVLVIDDESSDMCDASKAAAAAAAAADKTVAVKEESQVLPG